MLTKVPGLGRLLGQKTNHPLDDANEMRRIIAELPSDNAFKALDEIAGWLESLQVVNEISPATIYEAASRLEDAARPHLRRLAREYLHTLRLSRSDERRLWSINHGFWILQAAVYRRCLQAWRDKLHGHEALKPLLSGLTTRLIAAVAAVLKWEQFHYGPSPLAIWQNLGEALLVAEAQGIANKRIALPTVSGPTSPQQEYLKALVFQAASMDSLLPLEIEIAERLIAHFLPAFVFGAVAEEDSVYWVDLELAQAPLRLAKMPAQAATTQRFFKPGLAKEAMLAVVQGMERGGDVPPEINLGEAYTPRTLLPVLRHLAAYLAPVPPQRRYNRHHVKHRMVVMNGLANAFGVFSGDFGGRPTGLQMESWVVENVSRGGFGASLSNIPAEWLKIGALTSLQPEGGDNWLLGIVRRYRRETEHEARVGIETLAHHAVSVELRPRTTSRLAASEVVPGLLIEEGGATGEVRLLMPPASFSIHHSLKYLRNGQRYLLAPIALLEQTADYELARYRQGAVGV